MSNNDRFMDVRLYTKEINIAETFSELADRMPSEELASKIGTALLTHSHTTMLAEIANVSYSDPHHALDRLRAFKKYPFGSENMIWLTEAVHEQIIRQIVMSKGNILQRFITRILMRMPWNTRIVFLKPEQVVSQS